MCWNRRGWCRGNQGTHARERGPDENVGDFSDNQTVLWFGGEGRFSAPLRCKMASTKHFSHGLNRVGVGDGPQPSNKVVNGFSVIGEKRTPCREKSQGLPTNVVVL